MPLIESEDYPNKRIYLSLDAIASDIQPIDIYREHRERRRLNANGERNFAPMVTAFGNDQIGASKFTPRFTNLASGVKLVPYDTTSNLIIIGALISTEDQLEGVALFDRSSLVAIVDIDYIPPQVEIITVNTGSGLSTTQANQLSASGEIASRLNAMLANTGSYDRFLATALELSPSGSGATAEEVAAELEPSFLSLTASINTLPTLTDIEQSENLVNAIAAQTQIAQLIAQANNIHLLHGLDPNNPLVVSTTSRRVGDIIQSFSSDGGTTTVTRTD